MRGRHHRSDLRAREARRGAARRAELVAASRRRRRIQLAVLHHPHAQCEEHTMSSMKPTIVDNREAVDAFITAARAVAPSAWTAPRAPGKWSPGQVTEHV